MAYAMTKQGSRANTMTYEFMCDTIADMNLIENEYKTLGSIAIVLQGESDGLEVYICNSNLQWTALNTGSAQPSGGSGNSSLSIHVCAQNEIDNGLPDIASPDENTIYLVPAGNTSGNLYEEYIYVDDDWEKFGAASIDLSNYAPIANPEFTGGISLGRKANTTVGTRSSAIGNNVTASEYGSHAEGEKTVASAVYAHAEGSKTTAGGAYSHAEGNQTTTSASGSHAEGNNTIASGTASHAEGIYTNARGAYSHVEGCGGTGPNAEDRKMVSGINGYNMDAGAYSDYAHAEGYITRADMKAHSEGVNTYASGVASHAEGISTEAIGQGGHAEGDHTFSNGSTAHAEGSYTSASGSGAHAEGMGAQATVYGSHAEGYGTYAIDNSTHAITRRGPKAAAIGSHAEGYSVTGKEVIASGKGSHVEGTGTKAEGDYSHAEGDDTHAVGKASHVGGKYNVVDSYDNWNAWTPATDYQVGDRVKYTSINTHETSGYICKTAHTSLTGFQDDKWDRDDHYTYVEIIGNGTADNARSNARALTWTGDERLAGNLYVNCNADSTGGNKVISEADYATSSTAGVVKVLDNGNVTFNENNQLVLTLAGTAVVKTGQSDHPISVTHQHEATFYGLAKAAGDSTQAASNNAVGTYTDDAKAAIRNMLGVEDNFTRNNVNRIVSLGTSAIDGTEKTITLNIRLLQEGTAQLVIDSNATTIHLTKSTADNKIYYISTETLQDEVTPVLTLYHDSSATDNTTVTYSVASDTTYNEQKVVEIYYPTYIVSTHGIGAFIISAKTGYTTKLVSTDDIATDSIPGVVKVNAGHGIAMDSDGVLQLTTPTASQLQALSNGWLAPRLNTMHTAVFYGLAKAAGDTTQSISTNAVGLYTDNAKAAIKSMLGLPIPPAPVADGTYNLQVSVSDGTAIYNWVSTGA